MKKSLTRTQKLLYRVKSGYFATQLKPAATWRVFYVRKPGACLSECYPATCKVSLRYCQHQV
ncbi:hypothetical protein DN643_11940 [Escherichia coli]|nr:hypothetical protein [Escherichia coli]EGE2399966.1 hypothetical protein [Escherichia coli]KAA1894527.1 hypothetical protein EA197_15010 [Escherichia coli]KAA1946675.1 hypothetical protein EA202_26190 [Escherichia coli]KAA2141851.1 hypothetical protein EA238_24280 [Escherichia coli]